MSQWDEIQKPDAARKQFKSFIDELKRIALNQMKTPEGMENLRRDLCAMQGRPLGPCFEGETEENWRNQ